MSCEWTFNGRSAVSCVACKIAQYLRPDGGCARCHANLMPPIPVDEVRIPQPNRMFAKYARGVRGPVARVADVVRLFRRANGWSQKELAKRLGGLPRTYVSKIENGGATPNLSNVPRIAGAFGISYYFFICALEAFDAARDDGSAQLTHARVGDPQRCASSLPLRTMGNVPPGHVSPMQDVSS